ncbi:MAG: L-serine ammonia-lyase, iron-sulfur-dependent, subunit alpha [candidate division SR1 bacterium]|nr:L-serine ammonia-lyase, iron-sulfur-dependent, subunit alpha [candidate division SR1 bacterium]
MTYNVYKEVIKSNVNPAMGCTEPISVAYATSALKKYIDNISDIENLNIQVNGELYKNAIGVYIPNSQGEKGLEIAAALGIIGGNYEGKLEVLKDITASDIEKAKEMVKKRIVNIAINKEEKELFIEANAHLKNGENVSSTIRNTHTNLINIISRDKEIPLYNIQYDETVNDQNYYEEILKNSSINELIEMAKAIDENDIEYIKKGIEMNLAMANKEVEYKGVGASLDALTKKGLLTDDIIGKIKILTTRATDARMSGINMPVMSSGGSGNQGIISILVPYLYGKNVPLEITGESIDERIIYESIAFSHLLNSYVKCFTGKLSAMCGCAVAAGLGATGAIAYQRTDRNIETITNAINNLISDIAGILCDGAKLGCANKINTAVECSIVSALKAIEGYHVTSNDGIIGKTAEESIKNLGKITKIGMSKMNNSVLTIMDEKI